MWTSMLEQNSVWNGGLKIEKWCGIVWIGGKICITECDVGVEIKMTQNVCGMGGFLPQKACVLRQYLLKVLEMCGMGAFSVTPCTKKNVWSLPEVCGMGVNSAMKVHTIWVFPNFHV